MLHSEAYACQTCSKSPPLQRRYGDPYNCPIIMFILRVGIVYPASWSDASCSVLIASALYVVYCICLPYTVAPLQRVQAVGTAKKQAFHRACEQAFSKVVIAVMPGGKVGVQVHVLYQLWATDIYA